MIGVQNQKPGLGNSVRFAPGVLFSTKNTRFGFLSNGRDTDFDYHLSKSVMMAPMARPPMGQAAAWPVAKENEGLG